MALGTPGQEPPSYRHRLHRLSGLGTTRSRLGRMHSPALPLYTSTPSAIRSSGLGSVSPHVYSRATHLRYIFGLPLRLTCSGRSDGLAGGVGS